MRGRDTRDEFDRGILYEYVEVSQWSPFVH
jgi:hypothetical protein